MIMNPTIATLLTTSVTVTAAIMVLVLIFLIPVLLQLRRTAHEAEKLIDSVRLQVAPVSRDVYCLHRMDFPIPRRKSMSSKVRCIPYF